jgi:ATP synthase in type III secretion protein N
MEKEPLQSALAKLDDISPIKVRGRVTDLVGLVMKATLPNVRVGDFVEVRRASAEPLGAEVVGFSDGKVILMPLGEPEGVGPDSLVEAIGHRFSIRCGPELLGRILDGLGRPLDQGEAISSNAQEWAMERPAPNPLERPRIKKQLGLGIRVIDGLCAVGEGQRVGLFAGSGVGKSTLLGMIAQNTEADIIVICLVGERGREVREFIEGSLGSGLERAVVVCATSDAPPLVRLKSAPVATAIAEYFRDQGRRVLLLMDSVTRYARALREVALAAGEPPARRGYPPSVFARLPRLLERTGTAPRGSITAIYTVLVEGDDMDEPVADEVRGILDGHIVLARELAHRGHFPAVDVLQSLSRVMPSIADDSHQRAAQNLRRLLSAYERQRDLILLGAYKPGSDPETDEALRRIGAIGSFLKQGTAERCPLSETKHRLAALFSDV